MSLDLSKIENFQDAIVTVMGLGRFKQGSGVGAAKWLMRHGAQIVITDLKSEEELRESVEEITKWYSEYRKTCVDCPIYPPVFVLGEHHDEDFMNVDLVLQNPGVPRESEFVKIAKDHGISVESDVSLFLKYCPFPVISITGTRGKSTTTALLGEMLKQDNPKTVIAGNITRSPLEDLDWILKETQPVPIILEMSSWLLESVENIDVGPDIAILTNAFKDHLDRYDSFDHYIQAKKMIFKSQSENQIAILNADQAITDDIVKDVVTKKVYYFSNKPLKDGMFGAYLDSNVIKLKFKDEEHEIASVSDINIKGDHNVVNALSASLAAYFSGIKNDQIKKALGSFSGLPGRQEVVSEVNDVLYVNDTTSTSPEGVGAALRYFGKEGNVVLIAGGSSKGLSFVEMGQLIRAECKYVVLFEGSATNDIQKAIGDNIPSLRVDSMSKAVETAAQVSEAGDVVLLSPGTSSFGIFKNEFDRGDQFVSQVKKLKGVNDDK